MAGEEEWKSGSVEKKKSRPEMRREEQTREHENRGDGEKRTEKNIKVGSEKISRATHYGSLPQDFAASNMPRWWPAAGEVVYH